VVPQVYSTIRYGGPVVSSEGFASCNASADPLYTEILALARQHNRTVTWGPGDINPWQLVTNSAAVWTNYKKNYLSTVGAAVRECGNLPLTTRSWSLTGVQVRLVHTELCCSSMQRTICNSQHRTQLACSTFGGVRWIAAVRYQRASASAHAISNTYCAAAGASGIEIDYECPPTTAGHAGDFSRAEATA